MKDIHDRSTQDLATLDRSFTLLQAAQDETDLQMARIDARFKAIQAYYHEKPYLAEALRRSVK